MLHDLLPLYDIAIATESRRKKTPNYERAWTRMHKALPSLCYSDTTLEDRVAVLEKYKMVKKEYLDRIPVIEQRSDEWYAARKTMLTASDFGQAMGVGKFGTVKDIYIKKCGYEERPFDGSAAPLRWGVKYEPVANGIYEKLTNTTVSEYGIIRHQKHSFIGASPDGVNDLGIMLEIKCPWQRKIDGVIPTQYLMQIQGQLEVCDLEECDYLECELEEFNSLEDVDEYPSPFKGKVLETPDGEFQYFELEDSVSSKGGKITYWALRKHIIRRVFRDREMFEKKILPVITDVWNNVLKYRSDKEAYDKAVKTVKRTQTGVKKKANSEFMIRQDTPSNHKIVP